MVHLDHPPFFEMEKEFDSQDVESAYKVKFKKTILNRRHIRSKVTHDTGNHGIKFLLKIAEKGFDIACQE